MAQPTLEHALTRLRAAVSALELAVSRRAQLDRPKDMLEAELALMQDDRARLATELDGALARANRLDATTEEMALRIDKAMLSIRSVIQSAASRQSD